MLIATVGLISSTTHHIVSSNSFFVRRTKEVFWMGFIASWGGQVPAVLLLTKYWRNDLVGLYTGMAIGYIILAILYSVIVLRRYDFAINLYFQ